ncbi:MAG: NAD-dependent epimerase/dehydratase family protein [Bacteroidetes bacterium]|nr:NAD-dependent epimerase/dehydratase family protein [Bacteroidota bacterium]MBS1540538.1 NAD-dependent epimerase/dehydratase family protein [Bacteroidota bacterium]
MKKILITGGAGFLGSSLAQGLLERGVHVVLVDNLSTGDLRKIPPHEHCQFIKCDVNKHNDIAAVITSQKFDYVFHYAAVVGVKRTLERPVSVLEDIHGIENMLSLCKNTGVKRFFFTSSSEVYGEPVEFPQHEETTPLNSRLPYAIVKNVGEAFCRSYYQEYGLPYTVLRFFNTYGPKQSIDFVMSKFIKAALANKPLTIYGDGSQSRTFCFVKNNVEAIIKCLEEGIFINDVVNIGSDQSISVLQLAQKIIEITRSKSAIEFLPPLKEGDMTRRKPDVTKMAKLVSNFVSLEEGVRQIIESDIFYQLNQIEKTKTLATV